MPPYQRGYRECVLGSPHHLIRQSCSALPSACPICKSPVTFGGGSGITKHPSVLTFPSGPNSGWKNPSFSHQAYHADSTMVGLYALYSGSSNGLRTVKLWLEP